METTAPVGTTACGRQPRLQKRSPIQQAGSGGGSCRCSLAETAAAVARRDYSRRGLSPTASTEKTPGEPPPSGQPSREASYAEKALGEAAAVEEAAVANSAAICPPWPSNTPEQGPASSTLCSVKVDGELTRASTSRRS
jgi:hypothetical protein